MFLLATVEQCFYRYRVMFWDFLHGFIRDRDLEGSQRSILMYHALNCTSLKILSQCQSEVYLIESLSRNLAKCSFRKCVFMCLLKFMINIQY